MKEPITKFDLEAAFKALDEIDVPVAGKVKANKPALTEIFSRKTKFDALLEEYYDVGDMTELDDAKEAREAEVAQAKLARIEKIVDLDAESPEDLLPSYVGKFIMQCPQCMTLFYKDPEDVEASEEDPDTVNVNEVCQHCGNESGYTLIGKVGEATQEEAAELNQEETVDVTSTEEGEDEELFDEPVEDNPDEDLDLELDELDLDIEDDENAEKAEEGFNGNNGGQVLVEELTEEADLDVSADDFEELINSPEFKKPISDSAARAMINELDGEEKEVTESKLSEAVLDPDSALAETIYDIFNSGKFTYLPIRNTPPESKKISDDTYTVSHRSGMGEVTVKFDLGKSDSQNIVFNVIHKRFSNGYAVRTVGEAQDAILADLEKARRSDFDIDLDESFKVNGETLEYAVINPDGTYAGSPCTSYEEARELAAQKEGRVIVELGKAIKTEVAELYEGVFDKLKDKFKDAIDNTALKLKTREAKADWLLTNIMKNYSDIEVDTKGQLMPDKNNQKFKVFAVIGYNSRDNKGNLISNAPDFDDKSLVIGKDGIQYFAEYDKADSFAKGWSMRQGNGPAFIYLANGNGDDNALFLCEYFMGELKNDQLEKYLKLVQNELKGAKLMDKAGGASTNSKTDNTDDAAYKGKYLRDNLATMMNAVDELQEATLEKFISDSLVESYGNVAGFRLAECSYKNDKLSVDGTIYFTSGNKRATSYVFTEAMISDSKISVRGLNEKLGMDKYFTVTGYTDNKTFITESFNATKK